MTISSQEIVFFTKVGALFLKKCNNDYIFCIVLRYLCRVPLSNYPPSSVYSLNT